MFLDLKRAGLTVFDTESTGFAGLRVDDQRWAVRRVNGDDAQIDADLRRSDGATETPPPLKVDQGSGEGGAGLA